MIMGDINQENLFLCLLVSKWIGNEALKRLNRFKATIIPTSLSYDDLKLKASFDAGE